MSSFLRLLLLLVIVAFTISAADKQDDEILNALNDSMTEQLQGLKETWEEVSSKVKELNDDDEDEDERIIGWGTTPTIIQPTPVTATPSTLSPILVDPVPSPTAATPSTPKPKPPGPSAVPPTSKPVTPKPLPAAVVTATPAPVTPQTAIPILVDPPMLVVALPPPAEVIPTGLRPLCGKRGNCYRWFEDEVDLVQDGFSRCDFLNEHWARKYCCVDTATQ